MSANRFAGSGTAIRSAIVLFLITLLLSSAFPSKVRAAAGDLDTSFGNNGSGKVVTDFFGSTDQIQDIAIQGDGKIIAAGTARNSNTFLDFALARYNVGGSLDPTFGMEGKVTADFLAEDEFIRAIALQPDGKILAAGTAHDHDTFIGDFVLARFNSDGSLDSTFGDNGRVITDFNGGNEDCHAIAIQPDGRIILAGITMLPVTNEGWFALARYNSDGSLDLSFGIGGRVVTSFFGTHDEAFTLLLQPDSKIIAAGVASNGPLFEDFALARYNADGSLDATFGSGGMVTKNLLGEEAIFSLVLQVDGKILAAGRTGPIVDILTDFALVRFDVNGSLDTTFGVGGAVITDFSGTVDFIFDLKVQSDERIVAAGVAFNPDGFIGDFALARYSVDGSLDSSFGTGGKVTADFFGSDDECTAMKIQPDGKLLVAGSSFTGGTNYDFALARYDAGCPISVAPSTNSFSASGGTGGMSVSNLGDCPWTAVSNNPDFITVTEVDNGSVIYQVAPNPNPAPRSGTITVAGQTVTVFQGAAFLDVPESHPFYTEIGKLSARGVTLGCDAGNFCPDDVVTRQQMAAFIIRGLGNFNPPQPFMQRFIDVPPENPFYASIDQMAINQITLGCAPNFYCPTDPVLRDQMAAFIIRALHHPGYLPPAPAAQRFADVPPAHPFYAFIEELAARQITLGCGGGNYCPSLEVTRGQMAVFLVRAFNL